MTANESETMDELASLAFDVARPTSFKPYAVERVFRESVKAITEPGTTQPGSKDCKRYVSGRLQKMIDRGEQVYPVSEEKADRDGDYGERVDRYADFFVEEVFVNLCEGKPSRLKRLSNNFADGFYSATLRLMREQSEEDDEVQPDNEAGQTTLGSDS
jgi:CRISPR-associated protein Csc3